MCRLTHPMQRPPHPDMSASVLLTRLVGQGCSWRSVLQGLGKAGLVLAKHPWLRALSCALPASLDVRDCPRVRGLRMARTSSLYVKQPMRSNLNSRTNETSSACCSAVSPGKPAWARSSARVRGARQVFET